MRLLVIFALAFALHAEDVPKLTIEQLQEQNAAKDQQILKLQQQVAQYQKISQEYVDAYNGCVVSRAQIEAQNKQAEKPKAK